MTDHPNADSREAYPPARGTAPVVDPRYDAELDALVELLRDRLSTDSGECDPDEVAESLGTARLSCRR